MVHLGASNRYISGDSPVQQSVLLGSGGPVKESPVHQSEPPRGANVFNGYGMADPGSTFTDTSGDHRILQDVDHAFATPDPYAMAIRRRGSGLLNLTIASDAELRRATGGHHGVPEHELKSAGVYLTLTNN